MTTPRMVSPVPLRVLSARNRECGVEVFDLAVVTFEVHCGEVLANAEVGRVDKETFTAALHFKGESADGSIGDA
jgi:hypothetical protein